MWTINARGTSCRGDGSTWKVWYTNAKAYISNWSDLKTFSEGRVYLKTKAILESWIYATYRPVMIHQRGKNGMLISKQKEVTERTPICTMRRTVFPVVISLCRLNFVRRGIIRIFYVVFNVLLEISNTYRGLGSSELLNSISIYRKEENFNRKNTPLQYLIQMYAVDVMLLFRTVLAVIDGSFKGTYLGIVGF